VTIRGGIPSRRAARIGEAIATILRSDPRFGDVLLISGDTKSSVVKPKLIEFLSRNKGKEIGDIVFYFSGHGDFIGDEFCRVGGGAQRRACLRPPHKPDVQFSRIRLS
jgi:hypothetical protein